MADEDVCLGICYSDNQLFYSVNDPGKSSAVQEIGAFDFNFNVKKAIVSGEGEAFSGIKNSINGLKARFSCTSVRILSPAVEECWTHFPRSVYDNPDEREAHISLLMQGVDRNNIEATWYSLSNVDQKLLLVRNSNALQGFRQLLGDVQHTEYVAEFEIGSEWQYHTNINGSFMTIQCGRHHLSISSYLLGKLRGATIIKFDIRDDIPYLWKLFSSRHPWMSGIHEQVYFYGYSAREIRETLPSYWDNTGEYLVMSTLKKMRITAAEETYGFRLERAFTAVLLSMNYDHQLIESAHENHNRDS